MTGYIVLGAFIFLVASHTAVFFIGYSRARKAAEAERLEDEKCRAESDTAWQREKDKINQEVQSNANEKKASLSAGSGRDRFDAIDNSLRNHKN
jgi:hypothetical protein